MSTRLGNAHDQLEKWRELAEARGELIKLMQDEEGQMTLSMLEMRSRIEGLKAEFEELRHKYRIFRLLVLHREHTIDPAHWRKQVDWIYLWEQETGMKILTDSAR